jgi:hypothetical protein
MTEDEARDLLADFDGVGGLEAWIAAQPWLPTPGGWTVALELKDWRFRVLPVEGGLRLTGMPPDGGQPAVWTVPAD